MLAKFQHTNVKCANIIYAYTYDFDVCGLICYSKGTTDTK